MEGELICIPKLKNILHRVGYIHKMAMMNITVRYVLIIKMVVLKIVITGNVMLDTNAILKKTW